MLIEPLEERIRDLCERLCLAEDKEKVRKLVSDLQAALHEHAQFVRQMASTTITDLPVNGDKSLNGLKHVDSSERGHS
jgi:hypothetical protein